LVDGTFCIGKLAADFEKPRSSGSTSFTGQMKRKTMHDRPPLKRAAAVGGFLSSKPISATRTHLQRNRQDKHNNRLLR
jgi:hypothetical protein